MERRAGAQGQYFVARESESAVPLQVQSWQKTEEREMKSGRGN